MTTLSLPQLTVKFSVAEWQQCIVLVLGGRTPAIPWLKKITAEREVWAVDKGIDICKQANIAPQKLIGDGDSASLAAWKWGQAQGAQIHRFPPEKDFTDTQLALKLLSAKPATLAIVTGAFGGRADHFFSTLYSAACQPFPCVLADETETLFFLRDAMETTVECHAPTAALSLLPLSDEVNGVTLQGTHWPLNHATLRQNSPQAISNVLQEGRSFRVSITAGMLGVYHLSEAGVWAAAERLKDMA
ncbi:MAG: thiamine diphosphokinase [Selenomonadaceae bacterium]|nr:thiamine diphosphokinase [Selenomonadaceae bacterium]